MTTPRSPSTYTTTTVSPRGGAGGAEGAAQQQQPAPRGAEEPVRGRVQDLPAGAERRGGGAGNIGNIHGSDLQQEPGGRANCATCETKHIPNNNLNSETKTCELITIHIIV